MYDPFRVQFLTVSLDSEVVLALVGVVVAGLLARDGFRRLGRSTDGVWDMTLHIAFWTMAGARLGWIAMHLDYYGRAPLQVAAIGDGGFLFGTGVLAAAGLLWRQRRSLGLTWQDWGLVVAPAMAAALVLDRAGCALTACGAGQTSEVPWALVRSGASFHPVGLYSVAIWAAAWLALRRPPAPLRHESWLVLLAAVTAERAVAWSVGRDGADGLLATLAICILVLSSRPRWSRGLWPYRGTVRAA